MPTKKNRARELATKARKWLDAHEGTRVLTVGWLHQQVDATAARHEWEQALQLLNISGDVSHAMGPAKKRCCAACREARYFVRRKGVHAR